MPDSPARRAPAASPRPTALPTRTVIAMASPNGTMKLTAETLNAIWCPATVASPNRPIDSAAAVNSPASIATLAAIGPPSRSRPAMTAKSGASRPLCQPRSR